MQIIANVSLSDVKSDTNSPDVQTEEQCGHKVAVLHLSSLSCVFISHFTSLHSFLFHSLDSYRFFRHLAAESSASPSAL